MPGASRHREIDAARNQGELSVEDLWLRAVALGGNTGMLEVDAYLHELLPLPSDEETVLTVAVNDRLDELHAQRRVAYLSSGPKAVGELDPVAIIEELLAAVRPQGPAPGGTAPTSAESPDQAAERQLSVAIQRSLLPEPIQPDSLSLRVRYRPAAGARIGGDWYDAFLTSNGTTCIAVGDVSGHDRDAAAGMAQLRNLLRGIAYSVAEPPAAILAILDRSLRDLDVGALATVVLAKIEQDDADRRTGVHHLCWSNAGHPPALLLRPDGTACLLQSDPDLMLGVFPDTERVDHRQTLAPGSTVLLYSDGLVERRDAAIDDGLRWLADAGRSLAQAPLDELCDTLLAAVGPDTEDDIALLALRTPERLELSPVT